MPVVVIVGTDKGAMLLRADDARERWELGELGFRGWRVTAAARDPGGRTYVAVATEVFGCAILASDDLERWEQLEAAPRFEPGDRGNPDHSRTIFFRPEDVRASQTASNPLGLYAGRHVDQIWKLHSAGGVLYAGVSEAGLFRSEDRGKSWQPVRGLNEHESRAGWIPGFGGLCLHSILSDARDPRRLWAGISAAGVFRSDDGGATWARKNEGVPKGEGFCVHGLAQDPSDADRIFRQDHRGMYRSLDGGESWEPIENGLPIGRLSEGRDCAFGFPVEVDPATGAAYAFPLAGDDFRYPPGGRLRVYRTRDGGAHWEALERGLPREPRYTNVLRGAMSVDRLDPCGVYVGTTSGHVFASRDRGESWIELPCTLPKIRCVEAFRL
jgi:photosystem II stability/assembly factor-like uncharacterized protein